jgi:Site-specific recombinase XerD
MTPLRQDFIQRLELKGYSPKTVKSYVNAVAKLAKFYNCSPLEITSQQIKDYLHQLIKNKVMAERSINLDIGALKTFYNFMLPGSDVMKDITGMKPPKVLPEVLTTDEVTKLLAAPSNVKHRAILELLYSSGIRLQECCDLEPGDIDRSQLLLHIRSGKGKKERFTIISQRVIDTLSDYYRACRPKKYLFEGWYDKQYSRRSIEKIVSTAAEKASIKKSISPHTLRHSFATHLHENGVSLQVIQKLLGHTSIKTTTIYSHVSTQTIRKVVSPLDVINNLRGRQ